MLRSFERALPRATFRGRGCNARHRIFELTMCAAIGSNAHLQVLFHNTHGAGAPFQSHAIKSTLPLGALKMMESTEIDRAFVPTRWDEESLCYNRSKEHRRKPGCFCARFAAVEDLSSPEQSVASQLGIHRIPTKGREVARYNPAQCLRLGLCSRCAIGYPRSLSELSVNRTLDWL